MKSVRFTNHIKESPKQIVEWGCRTFRVPRLLHSRKFHAYVVGMAKSGTSSMAGLFRSNYRAAHEPESQSTIDVILSAANGSLSKEELAKYLVARDKRLWLELDSSHLNYFFLDGLLAQFPYAKFILTIRDCYSWLDSLINHQLREMTQPASTHQIKTRSQWNRLRELRFRHGRCEFAAEEKILAEKGLYTLDGYLSYWARHNKRILSTVPKERLLVVKTHEISKSITRIADFLCIPASSLDGAKGHANENQQHFHIVSKMDRSFLERKVNVYCKELMDAHFPERGELSDFK